MNIFGRPPEAWLTIARRAIRRLRLRRTFTALDVLKIHRRIEQGDYRRASGRVRCACGYEYQWHSDAPVYDRNGDPFLKILCDDDLVHL